MKHRLEGMILGTFVGDAISLAPHWIYNIEQIENIFGIVDNIIDIPVHSYHKNKIKGDFTHYGDQTLLLFQYINRYKNFNINSYKRYFIEFMNNYNGYIDHTTKETLAKIKDSNTIEGCDSTDVSGASTIAPLIYTNYKKPKELLIKVEEKIKLTHNNKLVIDIGKYISMVTVNVINGMTPIHSMEFEIKNNKYLKKEGNNFISESLENVKKHLKLNSQKAIVLLGQSCGFLQAFPSSLYIILKYENNFKNAIVENVMAGGDCAARSMLIGMVLGAYNGIEGIPQKWLNDVNKYSELLRLLS